MKKSSTKVRVLRPPPRLRDLVSRPGGLPRELAIARCKEALDEQHGPAMERISALLSALEAPAATEMPATQQFLQVTDQVIALADIFGMKPLEQAAKRLSELLIRFGSDGTIHSEAVAVHVRAMRLLMVSGQDALVVASVMDELNRVLAHFRARVPAPG